jgi:hypothetical protein
LFEYLTADYIAALALYVAQRVASWGLTSVRVLEVGAGYGGLTHFLRPAVAAHACVASVTEWHWHCVDDGTRAVASCYADVTRADSVAAVAAVRPQLVLCAWMPFGIDWSAAFRACPACLEYVLIGHRGQGLQGHAMLTWGFRRHSDHDSDGDDSNVSEGDRNDDSDDGESEDTYVPVAMRPHTREGFERVDLEELTPAQGGFRIRQLSRFDSDVALLAGWPREEWQMLPLGPSRTTAFVRQTLLPVAGVSSKKG